MSLGARIQQVRMLQAVSQHKLSVRSDLSVGYIADVEAGRRVPSHEELERWAAALKLPFHRLFFRDLQAVDTPRLSPRASIDEAEQKNRSSIVSILFRWAVQGLSTLFGNDDIPDEASHP